MQTTALRTISPPVNASLLQGDYSGLTQRLGRRNDSTSFQPFHYFRGDISVGNLTFSNQKFSLEKKGESILFRNHPANSFPLIKIILQEDGEKVVLKKFLVERSDNSVQGELLYTRLFLLLSEVKKGSLNIKKAGFPLFNFSFLELNTEERKHMIARARLSRKLRFLELFFNTKFNLPEEFEGSDVRQIEILFRGVTEGEFSIPVDNSIIIFNYKLSKSDLENNSIAQKKEFLFEFNEDLLVLGKFVPIGKLLFKIDKASIANPRILQNFSKGEIVTSLRFNIFDYQIHHRFEKYSDSERLKKNKQKLEQFKKSLRREEPEFLVDLLDESLGQDITSEIAIDIVEGLFQFYDFPDRFSVLKPILEDNYWRIPIALTYPKRKPIWLEDAFVDLKTGRVNLKISFGDLLEKGKLKAKEAVLE